MEKPCIPICSRSSAGADITITHVPYDGQLDAKTMRRVNRIFLKKADHGYFYPLEPLDAYHDIWMELERKAANLPALDAASPHTYLCGVARILFLNWFKRHVEPARQMYRQVEVRYYGAKGHVGEDAFDADNYNAAEESPSAAMAHVTERGEAERLYEPEDLSAHGQGEALRGESLHVSSLMKLDRETVRRVALPDPNQKWKDALSVLLAALDDATCVRAFRAYVAANGNFPEAAALAGIPKATYYRKWPAWIAAARKRANSLGGFDAIWDRRH